MRTLYRSCWEPEGEKRTVETGLSTFDGDLKRTDNDHSMKLKLCEQKETVRSI